MVEVHDSLRGPAGPGQGGDAPQDLGQVHAARAGPGATAAAGAEDLAEAFGVDRELVHHPLAKARALVGAGVVAGCVHGEARRLAGVPVAPPRAGADALGLVHDVETVARGAHRRARPAAVAAQGEPAPQLVLEPVLEPAPNRGQREREVPGDLAARPGAKRLGGRGEARVGGVGEAELVRRDELNALGRHGLDQVAAADWHHHQVGAARGIGPCARRRAEARIVDAGTGDGGDRGGLAAPEPELVAVVPAHDPVQDLGRRGVARPRPEHQVLVGTTPGPAPPSRRPCSGARRRGVRWAGGRIFHCLIPMSPI